MEKMTIAYPYSQCLAYRLKEKRRGEERRGKRCEKEEERKSKQASKQAFVTKEAK